MEHTVKASAAAAASPAAKILKQYFGYDAFRKGQGDLIDAILGGRDALGVMPTGAGKSLCYQIPAMLLPGVTLVISPLISLMRDQVQALVANGIPAAFINSSLTDSQLSRALANAAAGKYKIIYIAPERLLTPSLQELTQALRISLVAVDEAHCISQWGQDFRPSYLDIPQFVETLPVPPVLAAFTATATPRVQQDILAALRLNNPCTRVTGFDRPNLYFEVKQPKNKYAALLQFLKENEGNGIVYCSTRKEVEGLTKRLQADGYSAARYHAGLPDGERSQSQDDFLYDKVSIIVATNAFGMGIDKSNVRFVVHYNMPQNVESYYQEAGRAGRDGLPSKCLLLYARQDIMTNLFLINLSENHQEIARNRQLLNHMVRYCETDGCLRMYLLQYFGETAAEGCGNCGNCSGRSDETDVTLDAQKVLSHIGRLNKAGHKLMFTRTANILLGKSEDFRELSTFGLMRGQTRHYIRTLVSRLTALGYVANDGTLSITPKAREVLFGGVRVSIGEGHEEAPEKQAQESKKAEQPLRPVSDSLLVRLKELRAELAREAKVPAYVIFSDSTLVDMCQKHPNTDDEMLAVSGVGHVKLARYGGQFLQLLRAEEPGAQPQAERPVLTAELFAAQAVIEDSPVPISRIADNFNAVLLRYGKPKISAMKLNAMLMESGYLESLGGVKLPTQTGLELGISTIERHTGRGSFTQCLYGAEAQRVCMTLMLSLEEYRS